MSELELLIKLDGQYYTYEHAVTLRDQLDVAIKAHESQMGVLRAAMEEGTDAVEHNTQ